MSRRQKIHQTLCESCVPEVGTFGEVWLAKAEQSFWYATRDGRVVNLSDVLNNIPATVPARDGKDGKDGIGTQGERGPAGRDGVCVCKKGCDSTVPGPRGEVGPAGGVGQTGPQGPAGPDTATVLADARAELAAVRAEFADLKLVVTAIHGQNKQCSEYIDFLRKKSGRK